MEVPGPCRECKRIRILTGCPLCGAPVCGECLRVGRHRCGPDRGQDEAVFEG